MDEITVFASSSLRSCDKLTSMPWKSGLLCIFTRHGSIFYLFIIGFLFCFSGADQSGGELGEFSYLYLECDHRIFCRSR
jgi:hypothetical protein